MIEKLFCQNFGEQAALHLGSCRECQDKLIALVDNLADEIPFAGMFIRMKMGGKTMRDYIDSARREREEVKQIAEKSGQAAIAGQDPGNV